MRRVSATTIVVGLDAPTYSHQNGFKLNTVTPHSLRVSRNLRILRATARRELFSLIILLPAALFSTATIIAGIRMLLMHPDDDMALAIFIIAIGTGMSVFLLFWIRSVFRTYLTIRRSASTHETTVIGGTLEEARPAITSIIGPHPQMEYRINGVWRQTCEIGPSAVVRTFHYRIGCQIRMEVVPDNPTLLLDISFPGAKEAREQVSSMAQSDWQELWGRSRAMFVLIGSILGCFVMFALVVGKDDIVLMLSILLPISTFVMALTLLVEWPVIRLLLQKSRVRKRVVTGEIEEAILTRMVVRGMVVYAVWCRVGGRLYEIDTPFKNEQLHQELDQLNGDVEIELAELGDKHLVLRTQHQGHAFSRLSAR